MLKFSGFLGYPKAEYVLVDLTIGGVHFGEGILTREIWENLKLLNHPAVGFSESIIQVMETSNSEEEINLVTKARGNNPGSRKSRRGDQEVSALSAADKNHAQRRNGERLT
jgi:hypothetical protein